MRIALGCMRLSTEGRPEEAVALATLTAAIDAGITVFDTARSYGLDQADAGHNERLLARAAPREGLSLIRWSSRPRPRDRPRRRPRSAKLVREGSLATWKSLGDSKRIGQELDGALVNIQPFMAERSLENEDGDEDDHEDEDPLVAD